MMQPMDFVSIDSPTTNPSPEVLEERAGEVSEDSLPQLDLEF